MSIFTEWFFFHIAYEFENTECILSRKTDFMQNLSKDGSWKWVENQLHDFAEIDRRQGNSIKSVQ